MANVQPTLRYETTGTGEDVVTNPILTGYNDPGATGYFTQKPLYGGESDNFYEYVWNPASYEYSKEALNNPDLPYLNASPEQYQSLYDLKTSNPTEYTAKLAEGISNSLFNNYTKNKSTSGQLDALEKIKDVNPQAYYNAQLKYLGQQMGWQIGQNTSERNAPTQSKLQELVPQAIEAGISPDQINSLVGTSLNTANSLNQQRIATTAADGGGGINFAKDILPGLLFVGASAAGMYGIDAALAAGAAASTAGGTGGAFVPAAGSGASFSIAPGAAYTTGAGATGAINSTAAALGGSGGGGAFVPAAGSGASFNIVPGAAYTAAGGAPVYDYSQPFSFEQMGPTYQELGITGVEGGMAGPTYGELGYTGLNQQAAIDAANVATSGGLLSNVNLGQVLNGVQVAKGLLGAGQNPLQAQPAGIPAGGMGGQRQGAGVDYSPILNLLSIQSPQRKTSLLG